MYDSIVSSKPVLFKRESSPLKELFAKMIRLFTIEENTKVLVDASAMGYDGILELITNLSTETGRKVVIIPIVNSEMDKLQQYKGEDLSKANARKFLAMAAENKNHMFIYEDFESRFKDPDDKIQDYVVQHKNSVMLITADKRLASNCRAMGISVVYLSQKKEPKTRGKRISTFYNARYQDGHLFLVNTNPVTTFMVKHGGDIFRHVEPGNSYELKIGDEVLLCRSRTDTKTDKPYVAFSHYEVISTSEKNNISTLYTHRFYDNREVLGLWNPIYKSFISEFMDQHFTHGEMCNTLNKKEFLENIR